MSLPQEDTMAKGSRGSDSNGRRAGSKKTAKVAKKTAKTVTPPQASKGSFMKGGRAPTQRRGK
jgi:hypothetical protein